MDLELTGQVVVVFGAARGIGRAIAEAFRAEDARVVAVDRDRGVTDLFPPPAPCRGRRH